MVMVVMSYLHPLLPSVHSSSVDIKVDHKSRFPIKTFRFHSGHVKDIVVGVVRPVEKRIPCEVVIALLVAKPGGADVATGRPHPHLETIVAMGLWQRLQLVVHIPQVVRVCNCDHQLIEVDVGIVQESVLGLVNQLRPVRTAQTDVLGFHQVVVESSVEPFWRADRHIWKDELLNRMSCDRS